MITRPKTIDVLFVCTGNICRSPTAHAVFEHLVRAEGLSQHVAVLSGGTGDWHAGEPPDARAQRHARRRGYDLSSLRARRVTPADLARADEILAMDLSHVGWLRQACPPGHASKVRLFLDYAPNQPVREVPDPYYGEAAGFEQVLDLVEAASRGLIEHLRRQIGPKA